MLLVWEAAKKSASTSGPTSKRGGGSKGWTTKKKNFFWALKTKKYQKQGPMTTKLEGDGDVKALVVGPLVEELFCDFPS